MGARPVPSRPRSTTASLALTSHLPQALSVALGALLASTARRPPLPELCGPGMRSMLRLARSDWPLWEPIVAATRRRGRLRALRGLRRGLRQAHRRRTRGRDATRTFAAQAFDGAARTVRAARSPPMSDVDGATHAPACAARRRRAPSPPRSRRSAPDRRVRAARSSSSRARRDARSPATGRVTCRSSSRRTARSTSEGRQVDESRPTTRPPSRSPTARSTSRRRNGGKPIAAFYTFSSSSAAPARRRRGRLRHERPSTCAIDSRRQVRGCEEQA